MVIGMENLIKMIGGMRKYPPLHFYQCCIQSMLIFVNDVMYIEYILYATG